MDDRSNGLRFSLVGERRIWSIGKFCRCVIRARVVPKVGDGKEGLTKMCWEVPGSLRLAKVGLSGDA